VVTSDAGPDGAPPRAWWLDASPDDATVDGPAALEAGATAEIVVVGLGASGLAAAVDLAERGVDVLGLDAVGVAGGAAGANGGFLLAGLADFHHDAVARHGRDAAVRWWHRTVEELERLLEDEPTARRTGSLRIAAAAEEEADVRAQLAAMRADGLAAEAYEGPEGRGLLVAGDGVVDPAARCRRAARRAVAAGARLVAPARVAAVGPCRVHLAADDRGGETAIRCGAVLVCVDGGIERLRLRGADGVDRRVPALAGVRTARLQMLATAPDVGVALPRPVYTGHGYDYVQQRPTGEVLLGGGRDVGGPAEWAPAEGPAGPPHPSAPVQAHLDGWLAALAVTAPVTRRWAAWAAFTDDRLPVDAEVAPGVHVVGGYSGHGNVLGPLLAREAARRALPVSPA
jgi:gamma-glutamylputrescine oxidase